MEAPVCRRRYRRLRVFPAAESRKDSPDNGTSTSVEAAMYERSTRQRSHSPNPACGQRIMGSWDHGIMVTLKASGYRSRSLRRHAIPQVRPSRSVGRERERRASTGVSRITSAAPCVRMACPSANAWGWSLGGQNPNLRTGVIHGGKSPPLISFPMRSIEKENKP